MTTKQAARTGNEYFAAALKAYGVTHVFMVPTVAVPAFVALADLGVTGIATHSEKAAAYMADGYARAIGRPGICMAQTVGATNLASGLRDARMMGAPVIAISGGRDPVTAYKHVYQEIEDFPTYEQLTKWNAQVDDVRRVPDMLRQAFRVATTGAPGPVHLELLGVGGEVLNNVLGDDQEATPMAEERFFGVPAFRLTPGDDELRAALALLGEAERPVILAGGGARTSGAHDELLEFATRLGIPVATSLTGKSLIDEVHPLAVGVAGAYSRPSANRTVSEADVMFVVGSHLGSQVTGGFRLPAREARVIQLDIDPAELGRNRPNAVSLQGDAKAGLQRMIELAGSDYRRREDWLETVASYVEEFRAVKRPLLTSDAVPIRPERLCQELTDALPDDAVLVVDTGHSGIWVGGFVDLRPTQTFLRAGGSLGWAYPASLGAKCAVGDRPVVCFTGDGGLYYHLAELETASRYGINSVLVVNNNNAYGQNMEIWGGAFEDSDSQAARRMWEFNEVNFARLAEELGCLAVRVEKPQDIGDALTTALGAERPAVVEVVSEARALPDPPHGALDAYAAYSPIPFDFYDTESRDG